MERRIKRGLVVTFLSMLLLTSCVINPTRSTLHIAAAASLMPVFDDLIDVYTQEKDVQIVPSFAATGQLAQQIRNGAPFDIFTAADSLHIDQLIQSGYLMSDTRITYASGELVLVQSIDDPLPLRSLDSLNEPDIERIAIANPEHAPYGVAAKEALISLGMWDEIQEKIIYAETVLQAAVIVATGNADAGIISRSVQTTQLAIIQSVPMSSHLPIVHSAAVVSTSEHPEIAKDFLRFLLSPEAVEVFQAYGLNPP